MHFTSTFFLTASLLLHCATAAPTLRQRDLDHSANAASIETSHPDIEPRSHRLQTRHSPGSIGDIGRHDDDSPALEPEPRNPSKRGHLKDFSEDMARLREIYNSLHGPNGAPVGRRDDDLPPLELELEPEPTNPTKRDEHPDVTRLKNIYDSYKDVPLAVGR